MSLLPPIISLEEFEREVAPIVAPPWKSKFGAVRWADLDAPGPQHEWLVKGLITRHELCMLAGPSQSGKSFAAIDLAMAIARGEPFLGHKVRQGAVVYQAGESAKGVRRKRLPAYRKHYDLRASDNLPFVMLSTPVDLYAGDDQTNAMIEEIKHWKKDFAPIPLELTVIDTYAAATPGADENSAKDMTTVLARCQRIAMECETAVLLVHHMNAAGEKPRGHTSIFANLDSVLICKLVENARDDDSRKIREITVGKMKDGESEARPLQFVLRGIEIGRDEDGEPVTSCVVEPPARVGSGDRKGDGDEVPMTPDREVFLRAVYEAIKDFGITPPSGMGLPLTAKIVEWKHIRDVYRRRSFEDKNAEAVKAALKRHGTHFNNYRVIAKDSHYGKDWVWLTGRKLRGFPSIDYGAPAKNKPTTPQAQDSADIPE